MPSTTLVRAIHEMEYELMLVDAIITDNATAEIIFRHRNAVDDRC
jgi:hypothetical protein